MAAKTRIEWCDATWNPIAGCTKISAGCNNCYAERMAKRLARMGDGLRAAGGNAGACDAYARVVSRHGRWTGGVELIENALSFPTRLARPSIVFVGAMSDVWHPDVLPDWRARIAVQIIANPRHAYLMLTKRANEMAADLAGVKPWPGAWLGVSIENERAARERRPAVERLAAAGWPVFVSYEPALGAVEFGGWPIRWLIAGGESGIGARPCLLSWLRLAKIAAAENGCPLFVKQIGSAPIDVDGVITPRHPRGADPDDWPDNLRVRDWPADMLAHVGRTPGGEK